MTRLIRRWRQRRPYWSRWWLITWQLWKLTHPKQVREEEQREEAAKLKRSEELSREYDESRDRDEAYLREASRHTCMLTEPFNDYVSFMGKTVHVCVMLGEQLEVPQWVKYVIDQSKETEQEAAKFRAIYQENLSDPDAPWN